MYTMQPRTARTQAAANLTVTTADDNRPTHVSHPLIRVIVNELRCANRTELVHYAGASYHDRFAWHVIIAWLSDVTLTEAECVSMAHRTCYEQHITADDVRKARGCD